MALGVKTSLCFSISTLCSSHADHSQLFSPLTCHDLPHVWAFALALPTDWCLETVKPYLANLPAPPQLPQPIYWAPNI